MSAPIIDAHAHVLEPQDLWDNYLEKKFQDRSIKFNVDDSGVDYIAYGDTPSPYSFGMAPFGGGMGVAYQDLVDGKLTYHDGPKAAYTPDERVKWLDEEGIDSTLIYPTVGLIWGAEVKDVELSDAYARAYNNWAVDFCKQSNRLFPTALVPILDIDKGVEEVKRVAKLGAKGVLIFATPFTPGIGYWDKRYDKLWATFQDLDLTVIVHPALNENFVGREWISAEGGTGGVVDERYLLYMESYAVVTDVQCFLAQCFQGAVFDRFPKLKITMWETGAGWIQHFLERHDVKYERVHPRSPLKMLPSEYFKRQMWIGVETHETMLESLVDTYGADRFLWGTDIPHWDAVPGTLKDLKKRLSGFKKDQQEAMLGKNAAAAFNL